MSRLLASAFAALLLAAPTIAAAQSSSEPSEQSQFSAEPRTLTDLRIDVVKQALQLSPEQMKYWPQVEDAIRARADARRARIEELVARAREPRFDRNFVDVIQQRAENLSERAAGLKKLATAWQPLYETLSDGQKRRMRVLGMLVLHRFEEGIRERRMENEDEDNLGAVTGSVEPQNGTKRVE